MAPGVRFWGSWEGIGGAGWGWDVLGTTIGTGPIGTRASGRRYGLLFGLGALSRWLFWRLWTVVHVLTRSRSSVVGQAILAPRFSPSHEEGIVE